MYALDDSGLATLLGLIKQTATSSTAGMMSAADKAKLDGLKESDLEWSVVDGILQVTYDDGT